MNYRNKTIEELRELLDSQSVTRSELFKEANNLANKYQSTINSFVTILNEDINNQKKKNKLTDIPYSLKDNFSTKGILTTASSNILKNYVPPYNSTVYQKLLDSGVILIGKTVLDELAMGGTGTTGHTGAVKNPWDTSRMIGGSSAGSAASVALGIVPFSIGSDTGDSVRKPAAYGGVVGFKPTYGRISRYGLFAFASSLDHVGVFARSVKDIAIVTDILKGQDEKDMTSLPNDEVNYERELENNVLGKKLFYIKEAIEELDKNDEVYKNFVDVLGKCKKIGIEVEEKSVNKDLLNAIYPAYMTISCAEATSNNSNLTGISFGQRAEGKNVNEIMINSRTKGFSELIKRRFVIGSYVLQRENQEKLFLNALRVRRMVVNTIDELFKKYDGLIMPTAGGVAPKFGEKTDRLSLKYLILENHLIIGNFGGYPSISIPCGLVNEMPISINITCPIMKDELALNIAYKLESTMNYKGMIVGEKNV